MTLLCEILYKVIAQHLPPSGAGIGPFRYGKICKKNSRHLFFRLE